MSDSNDSNEQGMNVGKWIGAAVAGALLMYAFDPERGAKRRARARGALRDARHVTGDKLENAWHHAGDRLEYARHRASNVYASAGERLAGVAHAAGDRLAEASHHTRDRLEHARDRLADVSHEAKERATHAAYEARDRAKSAAYDVRDRASHAAHDAREQAEYAADKARERGEYAAERARVRADEARERLEQSAYSVKAETRSRAQAVGNQVREWTDHLSQAFGSRSPTLANSALLGTGALSVVGLARRSPAAALLGLGALAVLLRSNRGRELVASLRNRGAASFVEVENAIHIDASPKEVFDAWSEVENFPRFMSHVTEVRDLGHRRSHWVVRGPGGLEYAWNAVTTEQSRPDRLSWRSEPGSEIEQEGTVTFEAAKGGTRVTVKMRYAPPAGALGHGIARMLGADPQRQMDDDLVRMKDFIENGDAQYGSRKEASRHSPLH